MTFHVFRHRKTNRSFRQSNVFAQLAVRQQRDGSVEIAGLTVEKVSTPEVMSDIVRTSVRIDLDRLLCLWPSNSTHTYTLCLDASPPCLCLAVCLRVCLDGSARCSSAGGEGAAAARRDASRDGDDQEERPQVRFAELFVVGLVVICCFFLFSSRAGVYCLCARV
jgi:hypothetical protein